MASLTLVRFKAITTGRVYLLNGSSNHLAMRKASWKSSSTTEDAKLVPQNRALTVDFWKRAEAL